MSLRAMLWVFDSLTQLGQAETLVMLALADFADEDGSCWPSQDTLARRTRMTTRSVRTHLGNLEDRGLVVRERRGSTADGRRTDRYVLPVGLTADAAAQQSRRSTHAENSSGRATGEPQSRRSTHAENSSGRGTQPESSRTPTGNGFPVGTYIQTPIEPPSIPPTPRVTSADTREPGGGRADGREFGEASREPVPALARSLVAKCLPAAMQTLSDDGITLVYPTLCELVAHGWEPGEIRAILAGVDLPEHVRSLPHLVGYRLSQISPDGAPGVLREARSEDQRRRVADLTSMPDPEPEMDEAGRIEFVRQMAAESLIQGQRWAGRLGVPWPLPEQVEEATA